MYVVELYQPFSIPKDVDSPLLTIVDFIFSDGGVASRGNPDTGKVVGVDLVVDKLPSTILMYVNAPCLAMVNFTVHHCWVGPCFHLKPCYPVVVNVARVKVALKRNEINHKYVA